MYRRAMRERIAREPDAVVDYISLVDPETLVELDEVTYRAVAALAVRIGKTRLIDNMLFEGRTVKSSVVNEVRSRGNLVM